jgi:chorismate mutase
MMFRMLLMLALCPTTVGAASPLDELRTVIADRLTLMNDVARYKWNAHLPVADPAREAALLDQLTADPAAAGLPRAYVRRVLDAQLTASRIAQQRLIEQWRAERRGEFSAVPSLADVQRPAITAVTRRLLRSLRTNLCALQTSAAAHAFAAVPDGLEPDAWTTAVAGLFPAPATTCTLP